MRRNRPDLHSTRDDALWSYRGLLRSYWQRWFSPARAFYRASARISRLQPRVLLLPYFPSPTSVAILAMQPWLTASPRS